ncbi:protein kinase domain protein [Ichthyophthirius multifiliis]|uniref:Protein kinase domain protein n=1 Tax=Ichthyophthirius multifiliis TaxID=5932 RepID=G0QKM9_ICHMU|nr:protein kinase domain protein [Ichthyophthirius multifiliis]EGR34227.1 protein kinase domain protein [Ichthyophthirius multifiliis]|eukprot:XP_004039531.1 protein kinase domain protein [Ichthyophthirius multifiliis]
MEKYNIIQNLGDGTYGQVYKAQNIKTGEYVAIKKLKRKYTNWDECMSLREVRSLRKLNHINLVKLKEIFQIKDELMLVFEYLELNLYQMYMKYKEQKKSIPLKTIQSIIYQIAKGLDSLHKTGYFHRDLKPENILINQSENQVKICDFGLAREVRCRPPFTEYVSTRWYRAPEVLLHSQSYNSPIDIFSLGCIMAELYLLNPLFSGNSELDQFFKIVNLMGTPINWNEGFNLAMRMGVNIPKKENIPLNDDILKAKIKILTKIDKNIPNYEKGLKWFLFDLNDKIRLNYRQALLATDYKDIVQTSEQFLLDKIQKGQSSQVMVLCQDNVEKYVKLGWKIEKAVHGISVKQQSYKQNENQQFTFSQFI